MNFQWYIFCIGVLLVILLLIILYRKKNYYPYAAKPILTKREYGLSYSPGVADEDHCLNLSKGRCKRSSGSYDKKQYMKYFHKIAQKHVDFVICDQNLYVLFAIELDDSSHETKDAKKRDRLKDKAFAAAGIPLKRITEIDKKEIRRLFR